MGNMRFKVGDRVRIKSLDWYNRNKDPKHEYVDCGNGIGFYKHMTEHCGKVMTISEIWDYCYGMEGHVSAWTDEMIEGLVESMEDKMKELRKMCTISLDNIKYSDKVEVLLNDYEYTEEGGKSYFVKKKKEYPKTYEECLNVLGYEDIATHCIFHTEADEKLFNTLYDLKICRDAYWKIAGDEMGLGKPWKPQEGVIYCYMSGAPSYIRNIFPFQTEEMRDAFYENFKEEIEFVKELL